MLAKLLIPGIAALMLMSACNQGDSEEMVPPATLSDSDTGHYCGMMVVAHQGPKAHIITSGSPPRVFWFTSVRDAITFTKLPEEPKNIAAFYVTDTVSGWEHPESTGNWIDAEHAHFVIGSDRMGGMGNPEAIPFSSREKAMEFSKMNGGSLASLSEIPDSYVLSRE